MMTVDTPFTPEDDQYHPLSADPYETETNWWSFNIPQRKIGCWIHAAYFPNRNAVTWRVFAWDEQAYDIRHLAYYRRVEEAPMPPSPDLRNITFPRGGYRLKVLTPLMKYALNYADPERKFALELTYTGAHPPRRFTPGERPFLQSPHLDQLGRIEGVLTLNGETIPIDSYSVRDRTWGPRGGPYQMSRKTAHEESTRVLHPGGPRWREIERERGRGRIKYIFGHCGPQIGFLGFVRAQEGDAKGWSPMNSGWLLREGIFGRLDKTRCRVLHFRDPRMGWTDHLQVELADDLGRTMEAEGFAVSRISERGYGIYSLVRWEIDGKIGWGEDQDDLLPDHFERVLAALRSTTG